MNLIEHLGGYESAKRFTNGECSDGFDVKELRDALLEYRRQHNIFEVGDYALPKKEYRTGDRVGIVEKIIDDSVWIVFDSASKMLTPPYTIRHATDEEIEAGHRL